MAQVPYSPVPSTEPSLRGAPGINVATPEAAFGGASAAATTQLGDQTSAVGTELFNRALAMQQLDNETASNKAVTDFMIGAGDLHAKYNALQGQARVDAYPKYAADLQSLQAKVRGTLTNPMAQHMYDAPSRSVMGRSIFSGAAAAGDAQRQGALTEIQAGAAVRTKTVYDNPDDEVSFQAAIDYNNKHAATQAALMPGGYSPDKADLLAREQNSTLAKNRIDAISVRDPVKGAQLFNAYKDKGLLFGNDLKVAEQTVRSYTHGVGMDIISQQVLAKHLQPDGSYDVTATDMQKEAASIAKDTYKEDPTIETYAQRAMDNKIYMHNFAMTKDAQVVNQQVHDYITKGVTTIDMLPPDLRAKMSPAQKSQFQNQVNTYVRSENVKTDEDQYHQLLGLYNNDNAKFMDTDIYKVQGLNKNNINFFVGLQRKADANGDPRVSRAMKQLQGAVPQTLSELGVIGSGKNQDTANKFVGTLHDAIQAWQETNGKPPSEKDITETIFPNVTKQITGPGFFSIGGYGTTKQTPFFQADVPDKIKAQILQTQPGATEEQIRHTYNRAIFNQFYGAQAKSKNQDRVGQ